MKHVNYERIPSRFMSEASDDCVFLGYKAVIESATREKTLVTIAAKFMFMH